METIHWDPVKNQKLQIERNISFEEILVCIKNRQVLAIIQNPSKRYKDQKVFVVELNNYIYYVPFVKDGNDIFLKTIIPSRKLTKKYLKQEGVKDA
ncbi:MAG: BrnT family toxin [Nitrospirota bacterium]